MARRDFPFTYREDLNRLKNQKKSQPAQPVTPPVVTEFFKFTDSSHPAHILVGLHRQWTKGRFLDVTVRVNDVSVGAHKSVLSAFSGYFEALFSSDMSDAGRTDISLPDIHVSKSAIMPLIEFAYRGTLEITPDNIQDLLYAANFLCVDAVIGACCTYLQSNLSVENCVDVLEVAVSIDRIELQQNIQSFMILHFEEFIQQEVFLKMPIKQLVGLLEKDELAVLENGFCIPKVEQEEKLLKVILRFVESKPEVNHEHLPMLMSRCIRLMLLPSSVLVSLKSSNWIMSSPECLKLLNRIISSEVSSEERDRWEHPRLCIVMFEKTQELASTPAVQSEVPTEPFDDGTLAHDEQNIFVTGMKVYSRRWDTHNVVGGIEVFYNIGKSVLHGTAGYGFEDSEFHLVAGERIISIAARTGWMVDQLTFTTNRGNIFGPYGGDGGCKHHLLSPCPGAYLAYITGTVDVTQTETAVRKIRFVWGFHKRSS